MDGFDPATGEVLPLVTMPSAIAAAIITVGKQVKQLGADDRNQHGGYAFVSVDKFYEQIGKLMAEAGLAVIVDETESDIKTNERTDDRGNTKMVSWLFMRYQLMFVHESGAVSPPMRRSCALPISGPQAFGAAQSYVEKQFLRQVFKVPTGEKDADDTAPQDGAAPASTPARQQHQRQQAAPSDAAKQEARRRWSKMRDEIDVCMTPTELGELLTSPAWDEMIKHVKGTDPELAEKVIAQLDQRAHLREQFLNEAAATRTEGYS